LIPFSERLKRRLFWIVSRICFTGYRIFPIFGQLRASIGIIRSGNKFLVIERNDGRGLSLPGGIAGWREPLESTLRREVHEETGLSVTGMTFKMTYPSVSDVPCDIAVYNVEATGEIRQSWEGTPHWMLISELEQRLVKSQRPILDLMREILRATKPRD